MCNQSYLHLSNNFHWIKDSIFLGFTCCQKISISQQIISNKIQEAWSNPPKKKKKGEPLRCIAREEFKLVRIMLKCNSYPNSPPNQTLNQIKIKSSPEERNGEIETSKNYRFKNRYGRSKNIALPFHFAMHFAIAGICRQLLNSMDLVLRCAWQKVKNKSYRVLEKLFCIYVFIFGFKKVFFYSFF